MVILFPWLATPFQNGSITAVVIICCGDHGRHYYLLLPTCLTNEYDQFLQNKSRNLELTYIGQQDNAINLTSSYSLESAHTSSFKGF
jgi:hypothetical protein